MSSLKKKVGVAFVWDLIGKVGNQGVGFVISVVLARLLEPADFGVLGMALAFSALANGFVNCGFSSAIVQKKAVSRKELSSVFHLNVAMGVILGGLFYLSSDLIGLYYNNKLVGDIAKVLSASFIINAFGLVSLALLEKELKFKERTYIALISGTLSGVVGLSLAFSGFGVWSLVLQSIINELLRSVLAIYYARFIPTRTFRFRHLRKLWGFGFNLFLSGLLNSIFFRIDYLVIGKFFPAATLGLFYRAKSFRTLVLRYTSESIGKVLFPTFSQKQTDIPWVRRNSEKALFYGAMAALFLIGGLYAVSDELFIVLFTKKWAGAVPYFKVLMFGALAFPLTGILGNVLNGMGHSRKFLMIDVVEKGGMVIGLVVAVVSHSFFSYLWIDVAARFLGVFLYFAAVHRLIGLDLIRINKVLVSLILLTAGGIVIANQVVLLIHIRQVAFSMILKGILFSIIYLVGIQAPFFYGGFNAFRKLTNMVLAR
jgi:O-antigen/teichoic acid export membrane protein